MLKNILVKIVMTVTLFMGTAGSAMAMIGEPDVVYYGTATTAASGSSVTVTLDGSVTSVASYNVGSDLKYVLRVPMDSVGARVPGTARTGDAANIAINGVLAAKVIIPARGTLVNMDLAKRDAEQWAADHPGDDGSGDMNRNRISDLTEYLDGNDPASCVWTDDDADHVVTTVYHQQVLKSCLAEAGADLKDNVIRVARGTYPGNFSYTSAGGEDFDLTLIGGYDPSGGAERSADPALTILNGDTDNDGTGNGVTLVVDTDNGKSTGKVRIESFTVKNGAAPAGQKGGGLQARIYQGDLELVGNIISGNRADSGGGLFVDSSDSAPIFLTNNILYGNSAATAAAMQIVSAAAGPVTLLNNSIVDNTATIDGDGRSLLIEGTTAKIDVTNNIISASAGVNGNDIYINSSGVTIPLTVSHNAYDAVNGLFVNSPGFVADAIVAAPQFLNSAAGNYRLAPLSPGIDAGIAHVKLPGQDAAGAGRISGAGVDLGAYEYHGPVTHPATALILDSATLNGTVNANNADTTVNFEYGVDTEYGSTVAALPGTVNGVSDTAVNAEISGLSSGVYHFRVAATSSDGTVYGEDQSFSVIKSDATVTLGNLSQIYDGTAKTATATTSPSGKTVTITYNGSTTLPTDAGSYAVVATISDPNYQGSASGTLTIGKAIAAITLGSLNQTYDGTAKTATATTTPTGKAVVFTYNGSDTLPTDAGSYTVVATISDPNYSSDATGTLTIGKVPQTISLATTASKTYGNADFGSGATVSSSLPLTYSSGNEAVATVAADGLIHIVGAGSVIITASQAGDDNHAATSAQQTLTISKANLTVTAANTSRTYGAADPAFTATYSGFVNGEDATVLTGGLTFTTTATSASSVGSYPLTPVVTGLIADNYSFTAAPGTLAIGLTSQSITFNPLTAKTYGDATFTLTASGGASGNPLTFSSSNTSVATVNGTTVTIVGAGTTTITADQEGTDGAYASATAQQSLTVKKAIITVTATNKNRAYDSANPTFSAIYSGFVNSEDAAAISGAPLLSSTALQNSPVGSYPITVALGTLTANNYDFAFVNATLAVGLASQSITFAPLAATIYGDTPFDLSAVGGASGNPLIFSSSNEAVATVSGSTVTLTGAGNATITANQVGNSNYAAATAQQSLTVGKAPLTVSAENSSRTYGAANPTFTAGFSGFVNNEDATALSGAPSLTTSADAASPAGDYPITAAIGNLFSNNYSFNYAAGTLTVSKATATVALGNLSQTYDGTARPVSVSTTPSTLVVTLTYGGSATVPTNAGTYAVVATISDSNYQGTTSGTLTIAKATATVTLGSLSVPYDGTGKSATAVTMPAGRTVNLTYNGSSNAPTNAGSYAVVATISDPNYQGSASGTLVIIDTIAPTLSISSLGDGAITNNPTLNVAGTVSDSGSGVKSVTVNGVAATLIAGSFSSAITLVEGENVIVTVATDNDDNQKSDSRTVTLQRNAPLLTVTAPADNSATATGQVTVTGSCGDAATVTIWVNTEAAQLADISTLPGSYTLTVFLSEGLNTLTVIASDTAANSATVVRTLTYDATAPTVAITIPDADSTVHSMPLTISGSVADALTEVSLTMTVNGEPIIPTINGADFTYELASLQGGAYQIVVTANDLVGNSSNVTRNVIYTPYGDVDDDGYITAADALLALRMAIGKATVDLTADVAPLINGVPQPDGKVSAADALVLLRKAVGLW